MGTHFEIWAGKWCFEMSGNEEKELRKAYNENK